MMAAIRTTVIKTKLLILVPTRIQKGDMELNVLNTIKILYTATALKVNKMKFAHTPADVTSSKSWLVNLSK